MGRLSMKDRFTKITLAGVGLLGGSLGLKIQELRLADETVGYVRRVGSVEECSRVGVVNRAVTSIEDAFSGAELVVFCTPVAQMSALAKESLPFLKPGTLVTDVGSTKRDVVKQMESIFVPKGIHFVGSHPMAGSEKTGPVHAYADLFRGALCLITPTSVTNSRALMAIEDFWRKIGCLTERLSPEEHDALVCRASHLPHIIAATLVYHALGHKPRKLGLLPRICASGFRDTTRVASGSPDMWRDIVLSNRDRIAEELEDYQSTLNRIKKILQEGSAEEIYRFFELARTLRNNWLDSKQK